VIPTARSSTSASAVCPGFVLANPIATQNLEASKPRLMILGSKSISALQRPGWRRQLVHMASLSAAIVDSVRYNLR